MTAAFPILGRLVLACSITAALFTAPVVAQASETNWWVSANASVAIHADGLAGQDQSLSWSETTEETILTPEDRGIWDEPALYDPGEGTSRFAVTTVTHVAAAPSDFGPSRAPIAQLGPFFLVSPDTVEMIGTVDGDSPYQFARLIATHPGIRRLVMVECPGSIDEAANHMLAREVRQAGLETHVPRGGSVRSGAVDLFLAGTRRTADRTAEFGVHSWRDEDGMEPGDFAANDPVNMEYINYYREMGLSDRAARQFYALTNSVPFESVRTLSAGDMARLGLAEVAG